MIVEICSVEAKEARPYGPIPLAGLFAEKEGIVVAQRIAARIRGQETTPVLDGQAGCFVEVGRGEGAVIGSNFYNMPTLTKLSLLHNEQSRNRRLGWAALAFDFEQLTVCQMDPHEFAVVRKLLMHG